MIQGINPVEDTTKWCARCSFLTAEDAWCAFDFRSTSCFHTSAHYPVKPAENIPRADEKEQNQENQIDTMADPVPMAGPIELVPIFKGGPERFSAPRVPPAVASAIAEGSETATVTPFRQVFDQNKSRSMFFSAFRLECNSVINTNTNDSRTIELMSPEWKDDTEKFEQEQVGASASPANREVTDKQLGYSDTVSTVVGTHPHVIGGSGPPARSQDRCDFELETPRTILIEEPDLSEQHTKAAEVEIFQCDLIGIGQHAELRSAPHDLEHANHYPGPDLELNAPLAEIECNIASLEPCLTRQQPTEMPVTDKFDSPIISSTVQADTGAHFPSQISSERSKNDSLPKLSASRDPTEQLNASRAISEGANVSGMSSNVASPAKVCCLPPGLCRLFRRPGKADSYGGTKSVQMPAVPLELTVQDPSLQAPQSLTQRGSLQVAVGCYSEEESFQLHHDVGTVWRRTGPIQYPAT
jgi:hypothetical protein